MTAPTSSGWGAPDVRPRMVATDLDGTFLSPDGTVSEQNRAGVLAAQRAGAYVVFVTGRPVRWLDVVQDLPGAHPTVIASNGAVLYDLGAGEVLDRICLDTASALDAVERLRRAVPDVSFAFESGTRFGYEPSYTMWAPDDGNDPAIFCGPVEEIAAGEEFVKLLVQSMSVNADDLLDRVRSTLAGRLNATHSASRDYGLVEVSAAGVHKGAMLARLCERLEVARQDVAAFGDMPNDLDMLHWAGRPHVVANAHDRLHDLGFPVVPSNADSGVGRTLTHWYG